MMKITGIVDSQTLIIVRSVMPFPFFNVRIFGGWVVFYWLQQNQSDASMSSCTGEYW